MTEKRFVAIGVEWTDGFIQDHIGDRDLFNIGAVCNLLNELSEENEQLKQSYKKFEDECQSTFNAMNRKQNDLYRKNFKLKEENEQLKQQLRIFEDGLKSEIKETKLAMEDWNECLTDCKKLKEENEQLKQTIQEYYETTNADGKQIISDLADLIGMRLR